MRDVVQKPAERRVLIAGIYLADKKNAALHITRELADSSNWKVEQRWVSLGERQPDAYLAPLTVQVTNAPSPKFLLLNQILNAVGLRDFEYVIVSDDDIVLPAGFLDSYLALVSRHDLAVAQPARTHDSYIDHRFVEQLDGIDARWTRFVEIGPLFSLHRSAFDRFLPFDEASPMGWGCDYVWPLVAERHKLKMGIVDAVPVAHNMRKPVAYYDHGTTGNAMRDYLAERPHLSKKDAFFILESYASRSTVHFGGSVKPEISVVICTYNRAPLLDKVLDSLCRQTLPLRDFEVVIINDGSIDDTEAVSESYASKLSLRYIYQRNAGLASAKNHGLFASRGDIVLFLDDDDIAGEVLLEEHVKTHAAFPADNYAVLGYTALDHDISDNPLMHFITEVGCFLFSYPSLKHGDILDYTYFWGGRSSCKRSLLLEGGVFNPVFRFGAEDIELGYRLSKLGLRVVYNEHAVSYTIRKIDFDGFCHRLERQGASNYVFSQLHPEPEIQHWSEVADSERNWSMLGGHCRAIVKSARHLDSMANLKLASGLNLDEGMRNLLYRAYWAAFKACKIKGIMKKKAAFAMPTEHK